MNNSPQEPHTNYEDDVYDDDFENEEDSQGSGFTTSSEGENTPKENVPDIIPVQSQNEQTIKILKEKYEKYKNKKNEHSTQIDQIDRRELECLETDLLYYFYLVDIIEKLITPETTEEREMYKDIIYIFKKFLTKHTVTPRVESFYRFVPTRMNTIFIIRSSNEEEKKSLGAKIFNYLKYLEIKFVAELYELYKNKPTEFNRINLLFHFYTKIISKSLIDNFVSYTNPDIYNHIVDIFDSFLTSHYLLPKYIVIDEEINKFVKLFRLVKNDNEKSREIGKQLLGYKDELRKLDVAQRRVTAGGSRFYRKSNRRRNKKTRKTRCKKRAYKSYRTNFHRRFTRR